MWRTLFSLALFLPIYGYAAPRIECCILDDATGQSLAARVAVTTPDGQFVEIEGQHEHVQYLNKRWCYVDGAFALMLLDSGVQVEIRRGFETLPLCAVLKTNDAGTTTTFRLRRWIDMRQKGYYNGDIHAHLPVPKEAHLEMEAEDLNALTLLHLSDPLPINEFFTGKMDTNSTPGNELIVGQEIQDFQMGHVTLLGLTNLISGYPFAGGGMEYWTNHPHWDLMRALHGTRQQNGMIVWSHICSLPGEELPIAIALGLVDGVELVAWNDPTQLPNHWEPWLNSGMSQAEFPVMRSLDLYY